MSDIDCVVVGFNEVDFDRFIRGQQQFSATSGAYRELRTNSVLLGDRRHTYMDLMNLAITRTTGRESTLNAFEMPSLGVAGALTLTDIGVIEAELRYLVDHGVRNRIR